MASTSPILAETAALQSYHKKWVIAYATTSLGLLTIVPYLAGRFFESGPALAPLFLLPAFGSAVAALWRTSPMRIGRHWFMRVLLALAALLLFLGVAKSSRELPFIGFRQRIYSHMTPDQLRTAAQIAKTIAKRQSADDGVVLGFETASLGQGPEFASLHPWVTVVSADEVSLGWGGGLVGHWGVRIYLSGTARRDTNATVYWEIEPDIAIFYYAD